MDASLDNGAEASPPVADAPSDSATPPPQSPDGATSSDDSASTQEPPEFVSSTSAREEKLADAAPVDATILDEFSTPPLVHAPKVFLFLAPVIVVLMVRWEFHFIWFLVGCGMLAAGAVRSKELAAHAHGTALEQRARFAAHSTQPESAVWLRFLVERMWAHAGPALSEQVRENLTQSIAEALEKDSPPAVEGVEIAKLKFGSVPPRIRRLKSSVVPEGDCILDLDVVYEGNASIKVVIKLGLSAFASVPASVKVRDIQLSGLAHVRLKFMPGPPFVRHVTVWFDEQPETSLDLKMLGGPDVTSIPGVSDWIESLIDNNIAAALVSPNKLEVDLERILSPIAQERAAWEEEQERIRLEAERDDSFIGTRAVKGVGGLGIKGVKGTANVGTKGVKGTANLGKKGVKGTANEVKRGFSAVGRTIGIKKKKEKGGEDANNEDGDVADAEGGDNATAAENVDAENAEGADDSGSDAQDTPKEKGKDGNVFSKGLGKTRDVFHLGGKKKKQSKDDVAKKDEEDADATKEAATSNEDGNAAEGEDSKQEVSAADASPSEGGDSDAASTAGGDDSSPSSPKEKPKEKESLGHKIAGGFGLGKKITGKGKDKEKEKEEKKEKEKEEDAADANAKSASDVSPTTTSSVHSDDEDASSARASLDTEPQQRKKKNRLSVVDSISPRKSKKKDKSPRESTKSSPGHKKEKREKREKGEEGSESTSSKTKKDKESKEPKEPKERKSKDSSPEAKSETSSPEKTNGTADHEDQDEQEDENPKKKKNAASMIGGFAKKATLGSIGRKKGKDASKTKE